MKKTLIIISLAALAGLYLFTAQRCTKKVREITTVYETLHDQNDSGRVWRDRYDQLHNTAQVIEADRKGLRLVKGQLLDSVAHLLRIRAGDIEQITLLSAQLEERRTIPVLNTRKPDGVTLATFDYSSRWLELHGSGQVQHDSLGELRLNYLLRDSLIIAQYRKRGSLFGPRYTYLDVASANEDMRFTSNRSFMVRDRPKPWGLGFQLGARYSIRRGRVMPTFSVGISYNFIRW